MSSPTPYSHESSWYAAMLYISGRPEGYVFTDPYVTDNQQKTEWAYMDGALDRATSGEQVKNFILAASLLIKPNGYLIASCLPQARVFLDEAAGSMGTWQLIERSYVSGRDFFVFWNNPKDIHTPFPEAIVWRHGNAIGDQVIAQAIAQHYSKSGFNTALMSTQDTRFVSINNPHIKTFVPIPVMQDPQATWRYTDFWQKRVRLFVNLDWSIEGHLLKKDPANGYLWSDVQRRAVCGKSYFNYAAELAGIGEMPPIEYHISDDDKKEAAQAAMSMGPFIFIQIAGSGDVHKWYPYWGEVIAQIFLKSNFSVYLSFGPNQYALACKIRDHVARNCGPIQGRLFMNKPRRSFNTNVALAKIAKVLVGVETGIMMALAYHKVPKVLLLSHSAESNFEGMAPVKFVKPTIGCHPCHRMHFDFTYCHRDGATGASLCQSMKQPVEIVEAIGSFLGKNKITIDTSNVKHPLVGDSVVSFQSPKPSEPTPSATNETPVPNLPKSD